MRRPALKTLAEQSGYSLSTLFRVLRGAENVKPETREAIVRLLNIHGYMVQSHTKTEKVVVDISIKNLYSERIAKNVLKRLRQENYRTVMTESFRHPGKFRKELEDTDIVIFSGQKNSEWFRIARDISPSVYCVSLFCENAPEAELHIAADNLGGTRAAADFLCNRFGRIAVFANGLEKDSAERASIFCGHATLYYPQVRCDMIRYTMQKDLLKFYEEHKEDYDAYFYQNGTPWLALEPLLLRDKAKIFRLMFNNPEYICEIRKLKTPKLDAYIDFEINCLQDLVVFYLRNRPLLCAQQRIITLLPTHLEIAQSGRGRKWK